jgi:dimeric dUTPase (all-alpha-NTP-PPase superfamily)
MIQLLKLEELIERYKINHPDANLDETNAYIKIMKVVFDFFHLQDSFQQKAMGQVEWWKVTELNNKPVNYGIAMLGEIGEGIASLDFKWWAKLDEEDKENFITELIDSLHFELSKTMVNIYRVFDNLEFIDEERHEFANQIISNLSNFISGTFGLTKEYSGTLDQSKKFELMERYIHSSIGSGFKVKYLGTSKMAFTDSPQKLKIVAKELIEPLYFLLHLMNSYGVNLSGVHTRYILKNALNIIRKENGYKEGTYQKQWISKTGVIQEDNYIALRLIEDTQKDMNEILTFDQIRTILNDYYKDYVLDSI